MAGLVPPARPKPLRRGEGPAILVLRRDQDLKQDMDARRKAGHDENELPADFAEYRFVRRQRMTR
jgi:hypothetical protein